VAGRFRPVHRAESMVALITRVPCAVTVETYDAVWQETPTLLTTRQTLTTVVSPLSQARP
jgi:hypothetical protein